MSRLTLAAVLTLGSLLSGCGTAWMRGLADGPPAPPPVAQKPLVVRASDVATVVLPDLPPPSVEPGRPADGRVFFDYDAVTIPPAFDAVLTQQARYLASHPAARLVVEGNTDERGSAEYNLALGQQRALAVLQVLTREGAAPEQLEAVSWGREKPLVEGHDESAWANNRRADLHLRTP